jgi:Ca2+-binding RTX toxin-like protein
LIGEAGVDTATFSVAAAAVSVNLATNVAAGEGADTLNTIENAVGSPHNDTLIGNSAANRLDGLAGNDTIVAGAGNDAMVGGLNTDSCNGGVGVDTATTCETVLGVP